jgi:hypothetical protein
MPIINTTHHQSYEVDGKVIHYSIFSRSNLRGPQIDPSLYDQPLSTHRAAQTSIFPANIPARENELAAVSNGPIFSEMPVMHQPQPETVHKCPTCSFSSFFPNDLR